jgi:pantoate--beta-alanine ligase
MKVFTLKSELRPFLQKARSQDRKIGFIPTMGAIHKGHLALVHASRKEAALTVASIFVNRPQFNNREDFLEYPKTLQEDLHLLKKEGCDVAYTPPEEDLYDHPLEKITDFKFGEFESRLEGKYRPGHFNGVALIVTKLFNIIQPDYAYFGQKDLQQFFLIKQLICDLSYNIQIRSIPTIRENDGLALSSRNLRIPKEDRPYANTFYTTLVAAREMLADGKSVPEVKTFVGDLFSDNSRLTLEYFEVVDTRNFSIVRKINNPSVTALCIAGYLNNIRLIDNVLYN